ncbi:hypothetical protein cyc_06769 [Cyclospora cayetanensis]|uniref:Uncharacterized protein n=1 Tax=Cyclospora cayetanensis TaxID=88456 RepID=A0A1D3CUG5_9EIME|nr:hypothetical protein cyc_06769 [Cyclospora cayetanensis]
MLYEVLEPFPLPELQRLPLEDVLIDTMAALPAESSDASLFFLSQAQDPPDVGKAHEALCSMEASGKHRFFCESGTVAAYGILPAGMWAASLLVSDRQSVFECQRESPAASQRAGGEGRGGREEGRGGRGEEEEEGKKEEEEGGKEEEEGGRKRKGGKGRLFE